MKIEQIDINEIKINPDNPRVIRDEKYKKLIESIKSFPEMLNIRPIVIDKNKMILGGNMRYSACLELKYEKIPVIIADKLSKKQLKEFIIKDNVNNGEWNLDKLITDWDKDILDMCGFDMNLIKYSEALDPPETDNKENIKSGDINSNDVNGNELNDIDNQSQVDNVLICPKCGFEFNMI